MLAKSNFIQPYPQPALNNELGLTSEELAQALQVRHDNIRTKISKINQEEWKQNGFIFTKDLVNINDKSIGRPKKVFAFNIAAAKFFIAKYDNDIGRGYFRYLLQCENLVENELPKAMKKLEERFSELGRENELLRKKLDASLVRKKTIGGKRWSFIYGLGCVEDIFGGVLIQKRLIDKQQVDEMSKEDRDKFKIQHSTKVLSGLTKQIQEILSRQQQADEAILSIADQLSALSIKLDIFIRRPDLEAEDISSVKVSLSLLRN